MSKHLIPILLACLFFLPSTSLANLEEVKNKNKAEQLEKKGHYKEALTIYQKLLSDPQARTPGQLAARAEHCLGKLNRTTELDTLRDQTLETFPNSAEVAIWAATRYLYNPHSGIIIAGEFKRGQHRGAGQYADASERDRIRALQLLTASIDRLDKHPVPPKTLNNLYQRLDNALIYNRQSGYRASSWKLQQLSDLQIVPDYDTGNRWGRGYSPGAPAHPDGSPVYYRLPDSWDAAKNDGERWRWALEQQAQLQPTDRDSQQHRWAKFLHSQFGVRSMASYHWFQNLDMNQQKGILQLHTLKENETIAKLASGVKRFTLPDDQNFIAIYQALSTRRPAAADELVQIFLDRRQHQKAATLIVATLERFPKDSKSHLNARKKLLQQITGNWGKFEARSGASPAGNEPKIDFVFRNANSVTISVRPVDTEALVNNLWEYLEDNPRQLKWNLLQTNNLGHQLINDSRKKYLGKEIARRTHALKPRSNHWDTRTQLSVPVTQAGAYLVTSELNNGESAHTVVWIDSGVIVSKSTLKGTLYYLCDATTGTPLPSASFEFFGYQQKYLKKPGLLRKYNILTKRIQKTSGKDGTLLIPASEMPSSYRWMIKASKAKTTALLGFSHIRSTSGHHNAPNQRKSFGITDRPVYQPKQTVHGKFWIRDTRYDLPETSNYAGQSFSLTIHDAAGTECLNETKLTADSYGGVEYQFDLPEDAKLGQFRVNLRQNSHHIGYHTFRVEEYKKPEFEVLVDAPDEAVQLGESFTATVRANYYHGAPVTEATARIKVMRSRHQELWFPLSRWDWLYGGGYGWLDVERPWLPGWKLWGGCCPRPFWWHRASEQPEIVLEQELPVGPDGRIEVKVDTALAKAVHSDSDHRYTITAEVVDASRRTIVGSGQVTASRQPYQVSVWLDRGYARTGEAVTATVASRTIDGKAVNTKGRFVLYQLINQNGKIKEKEIKRWKTQTQGERNGEIKWSAAHAGQFRLAAIMTDTRGRQIEGAVMITVRGDPQITAQKKIFQYNEIELIPDKRTYRKGDTVKLLVNTKRPDSTVIVSIRGGAQYQLLRIKGQSQLLEIPVSEKDMPNFFVEAATVSDAQLHTTVRELIVPPEKRVLQVEVLSDKKRFKPQAKTALKVRITDQHGEPVQGSVALTIYDKSLEYISAGSNVADIKQHFWKWRRHFRGGFNHSLNQHEGNALKDKQPGMQTLGAFGHSLADNPIPQSRARNGALRKSSKKGNSLGGAMPQSAPSMAMESASADAFADSPAPLGGEGAGNPAGSTPQVTIRKDFADLVKWVGSVETDARGVAEIPVTFPDNLTTWKIKSWAMAHGTRVGEGSTELITSKDLIIRLQAPRFFIEKDQVTLSAVVHNYLKTDQEASISLELEGGTLQSDSPATQKHHIAADGEKRIDWHCKVTREGEAIIRMKVITPDDSDAMEMSYPVYVHGILKQEAWSRVIAPQQQQTDLTVTIPAERRPDQTRLEIRYSPTIAGSIVDAIPYLASYPYGCTEQTLNRFVPTVIAQQLIRDMDIDLEQVRNKRSNLNPQEIGDDQTRMAQWKRWQNNPVFNPKEVDQMTIKGIERLGQMQLSDGGWGWFSGYGERSYPHTTAVVVHGLLSAQSNGAQVPKTMINKGLNWLKQYEKKQTNKIKSWKKRKRNTKQYADSTDALIRMVLAESKHRNQEMLGFLFRDKNQLPVYAKSLTGIACHLVKEHKKRDTLVRNIMQFLVYDEENQSAHLKLGNGGYWWCWYGSEMEAHAWFLKLLAATQPDTKETRGLVKYLINNRKHATYWNSTRDTAYCIEAIADYLRASGENNPNAEITVRVDGKIIKTVSITKQNLFSYDNKVVIVGDALSTGDHQIQISRKSQGPKASPIYTNAYLTVFTKQDMIQKAGLEVKVDRSYYKLERVDAAENIAGDHGQVVQHKVEKYKRIPLKSDDLLASGDLVEVELHIHSKNDYEYLLFNDWKPAGFEAVDLRSGYTNNGIGAYMELKHEKTCFFVRRLSRGEHSLKYRLRAEIPGRFSALPTQVEAMYAPELKANSNEIKLRIQDKP